MSASEQRVVQYLTEAHATERALTRVLQEQIAVTPRGRYRDALERHLDETQDHAERVRDRLDDLGVRNSPLRLASVLVTAVAGQAAALAKTPLDLIRGSGGEEKVLKNAKDAAATEALEIATYLAIERLAADVGDTQTERLAREIRSDEQRMLEAIIDEVPQLTGAVVQADVRGNGTYELADTGAGETARAAARKAVGACARQPWPGYDEQNVQEIRAALNRAGEERRRAVVEYERRHKDRAGVLQAADHAGATA